MFASCGFSAEQISSSMNGKNEADVNFANNMRTLPTMGQVGGEYI